jgi:AbrB family looped-hinge helix DNA binding protein
MRFSASAGPVSHLATLLGPARGLFTAPSFAIFTELLTGWLCAPGRRTITAMDERRSCRWYTNGMRATIDQAGRVVIPKALRDQVGLTPGDVEIVVDGAGLRVEPIATDDLDERDGFLVVPASGTTIDDDIVRTLRDADQR